MSTDPIGYRYTDDELATLRLILSLETPVGCAQRVIDEAAYRKSVDSLAASKILTPAGESAYIDKLTAMLLNEISAADACLRIISQNHVSLLFRCQRLFITEDISRGMHTLTPFKTMPEAAAALIDSISRHVVPAEAALVSASGEDEHSFEVDDSDTLLRSVNELLTSLSL